MFCIYSTAHPFRYGDLQVKADSHILHAICACRLQQLSNAKGAAVFYEHVHHTEIIADLEPVHRDH